MLSRIAIIVACCVTVSSAADASCLTRHQARRAHPAAHLYWHGAGHCWNATRVVRHSVRREAKREEPPPPPPLLPQARPQPTEAPTLTPENLRRWANTMALVPPAEIVEIKPPRLLTAATAEAPTMTTKNIIVVIAGMLVMVALTEVMFGGMIARRD